jgi:glutathione S-transferase
MEDRRSFASYEIQSTQAARSMQPKGERMKLYNSIGPNPKLVRMFAAEKSYAFSELVAVDLPGGENRKGAYLEKNAAGQLPCVELDDGSMIAETIAICELIEELQPEPALIGSTPEQRAETRMWVRRVEWKVAQPMADGFRFAEGLAIFKDRIRTLPEAAPGLKAIAQDGLVWFDAQLATRETIVPGRFTLADIVLFAFLEFGGMVGQSIDPALGNLQSWFEKTKARSGAAA